MRILLVQDRPASAPPPVHTLAQGHVQGLVQALERSRGTVDVAADAAEVDTRLHDSAPYDALVIDLTPFEEAALALLARLRARGESVPVLLLVPGAAACERVRALDAGADDCLAKPVDLDELEARLRAVRRRALGHAGPRQQVGQLVYDSVGRSFHIGAQRVVLPPREHHLLELLIARPGQTLSKRTLAERLCPAQRMLSPDALEIYVHRLRRKLAGSGAVIQTLRGLGYLLEAEARR